MKIQQVSDNCYAVLNEKNRLCDANSGFIALGEGVVVDTQCDLAHAEELRSLIAELGFAAPAFVVNTHEDADHVWGNQIFIDSLIVAHESVPRRMRRVADPIKLQKLAATMRSPWIGWMLRWLRPGLNAVAEQLAEDYDFNDIELVFPTELFEDHRELILGDELVELIYVGPAHQVGDTIVHVPSEGVVFAGDVVFQETLPIAWAGTQSSWLHALDVIRDLEPKVIVPGHGPVCGIEALDDMQRWLEDTYFQAETCHENGIHPIEASKTLSLNGYSDWNGIGREYVTIARAYREFEGKPFDEEWNMPSVFENIYKIAKARGIKHPTF